MFLFIPFYPLMLSSPPTSPHNLLSLVLPSPCNNHSIHSEPRTRAIGAHAFYTQRSILQVASEILTIQPPTATNNLLFYNPYANKYKYKSTKWSYLRRRAPQRFLNNGNRWISPRLSKGDEFSFLLHVLKDAKPIAQLGRSLRAIQIRLFSYCNRHCLLWIFQLSRLPFLLLVLKLFFTSFV